MLHNELGELMALPALAFQPKGDEWLMLISFILFLAQLLIAGALIRLVEIKAKDSAIGRALTFAY
jgi:hypothetical protein